MKAQQSAYRSLVRLCRKLDGDPMLLACLLGRPPQRFHPGLSKLVRVPPGRWPLVDDAIYEVSGHSTEYCHAAGGAVGVARRHRQCLLALGLDYGPQAAELERRLSTAARLAEEVGVSGTGSQQEALPEHCLDRIPANSSEPVVVGDLLLTHPASCLFQPALDRAVILIDEAAPSDANLRGLVLNKPDGATVGEALASWPEEERRRFLAEGLEPLLAVPLYTGGDLVQQSGGFLERIRWLHGLGDQVPDATPLAPGICVGGDLAVIARLVHDKLVDPSQLRPCVGFAGWAREQFTLELQRGVWVRARVKPAGRFHPLPDDGISMWRQFMLAVGLPALADFPRSLAVDGQIRAWMESHWQAQVEEIIALHAEASSRTRSSSS